MKVDDRVQNLSLDSSDTATVLEVHPEKGIRLRWDSDAEFAEKNGLSNTRAEQTWYPKDLFEVVEADGPGRA